MEISDKKDLKAALVTQLNYYKAENERLESVFKKLNLTPEQFDSSTQVLLDDLVQVQEKYETKDCDTLSIALAHAEQLFRLSNTEKILERNLETLNQITESLSEMLEFARRTLKRAENKINFSNLNDDELKSVQQQTEGYIDYLIKMQHQHSSLSSSNELQKICKEGEATNELLIVKQNLQKELEVYQDLKPNLKEAAQQLEAAKEEFQSLRSLSKNSF